MDKYEFGNRLTEYRTQKGLTQSELGEILGVSNKAVSKWENGSAMPRLDIMIKITEYFDVSLDQFLGIPSKQDSNDQEIRQEYLKLYNEKMLLHRIVKAFLFVVLPIIMVIAVLTYIFGPPIIVRIKYNSLPDFAKHNPEQFQNYDSIFDGEGKTIEVGNVRLVIPNEFELDISSDEKTYYAPNYTYQIDGESYSDLYAVHYSYDEEMEHYYYFLNREGWCLENFGREIKTEYDTKWLFYNYDFSNIKLCDWQKAKMSLYILTINGVAAPINERIVDFNGSNAKGFIFIYTGGVHNKQYYTAELYNDKGEKVSITFADLNTNDPFGYEEFCKVLNSVVFMNENGK